MKKGLCAASIVLILSLLTTESVLAKPKSERGNPNNNYNPNPNAAAENYNQPRNNNRSNAGGYLRGRERAAYVHCLNAAKKNRQFAGNHSCAQNQVYGQGVNNQNQVYGQGVNNQNQVYGQGANNIRQVIPDNLPVNISPIPGVEQK